MTSSSDRSPGVLRLHYNENTAGCSPAVLAAIGTLTPEDIATYPDYRAITDRAARWLRVPSDGVVLTNGLDEGLQAVAQFGAWHADDPSVGVPPSAGEPLLRRTEFIQIDPTFEMFEVFARIVRASLVRIAPEKDFRFPLSRVLDAIRPETRVIYLVDPGNPTGLPLPDGAAETIAAAAPGAIVFVDEAYADFSGRSSMPIALTRMPNLVIGRTFAKAHGLAGLRIGALVGQPATLDRLRQVLPPFNVNVAAVKALEAALADSSHLRRSIDEAAASRAQIEAFCARRALKYWPSSANFVLVRVGPEAGAITAALAARGILVRDKSDAPGCEGCLRITAGVRAHTDITLSALEDILAARAN